MSKALECIRKGFNNPDIQPVKEWSNEQGEIGVYRTVLKGRWTSVYFYLFIFLGDEEYRVVEAQEEEISLPPILKHAEMIAKFANAKEQQS